METLFNPAWWMPAAGAVAGIAMFISGARRLQKPLRNGGAGLLIAVIAWGIVAWRVQTPLERCAADTHRLVAAVNSAHQKDWQTLRSILNPYTTLSVGSVVVYPNREKILAAARQHDDDLKSISVISTEARKTGTLIAITLRLRTTQSFGGMDIEAPALSTWQFSWQQTAGGWALMSITCLQPTDAMRSILTGTSHWGE